MALAVVVLATISASTVFTALLLGIAVLAPAAIARSLGRVLRDSVLLALPLGISALLINAFLYPGGGTVVAEVGPFHVTREGLALGAQVGVRVLAIAAALVLFSRTTRPSELVASLERRGVSPRITFVVHQALVLVPRTLERASQVAAAQRARGFDAESTPWRRVRGVMAIAAPTVLGAIEDAEARTLTLEARGFSRPGSRTLLWVPRDTRIQRLVRWLIVIGVALVVVAPIAGIGIAC